MSHFCPLKTQKIRIMRKWKKCQIMKYWKQKNKNNNNNNNKNAWSYHHHFTQVHQKIIIVIFYFGLFLFVYPEKSKLKKIEKKKKNLGISSFYTSEPKSWSYATLFLRYGVGQIVIIFHFRLFFALLPQHQKSKF